MSVEFAYRYRPDAPLADLRDLDVVLLTADVTSDEDGTIPAGTEGTIVSVDHAGNLYVVEFDEPEWALATVEAANLKLVERATP